MEPDRSGGEAGRAARRNEPRCRLGSRRAEDANRPGKRDDHDGADHRAGRSGEDHAQRIGMFQISTPFNTEPAGAGPALT